MSGLLPDDLQDRAEHDGIVPLLDVFQKTQYQKRVKHCLFRAVRMLGGL